MRIEIPKLSVVALVGVSGSGKTTFALKHFRSTEVLSSDFFRALISDDETNQAVSDRAFDTLYYVAGQRLSLGLLTVIDATNVSKDARASVLKLAREQNVQSVAIVLDVPENVCAERNAGRQGHHFGAYVVPRQERLLKQSIRHLKREGFRHIYVLQSVEDIDNAEIVRVPLWTDKRDESGPFDIIGDIHGCYAELCELLTKLSYTLDGSGFIPPAGRKAIFLGDLCDRGPQNAAVLRLVMDMVKVGRAYCLPGNHDVKLLKALDGAKVEATNGLQNTLDELDAQGEEFKREVKEFLHSLISHYVFDNGRLVTAHAGLKEAFQGRASAAVRDFCLYGDTNGETDEYGLPVRLQWAKDYRGKALVVFGHVPAVEPESLNNTLDIDTGCVYGGKLTAFRYPERELVQVEAKTQYFAPKRPLKAAAPAYDDMLNIEDVEGQRYISTRLRRGIKINAENSAAALEVMSRFAADPHWLIYLPPTMSPCETSKWPDYLEYPDEAFDYYKQRGVGQVVCERKHMGSRTVVICCRSAEAAAKRFHVNDGKTGILYTRTGRRFFADDPAMEETMLERLRLVLDSTNFWDDFHTDWVCLDAELMPWSAKAQKLLQEQYAPVGRAGKTGLSEAVGSLESAIAAMGDKKAPQGANPERDIDLTHILKEEKEKLNALTLYTESYRRYCWDVSGIDDYRLAPFHLLATEGKVWNSESHIWHMETIAKYMTGADQLFMATDHIAVDVLDEQSRQNGTAWWLNLTESGGEGMVVKPMSFIAAKGSELLQPAIKCRGREYLRIIYGPEYNIGQNLERLKRRGLSKKRNMALNEFALGMESLERFVRGDGLSRVHECAFGVLAMESEPVDPRL